MLHRARPTKRRGQYERTLKKIILSKISKRKRPLIGAAATTALILAIYLFYTLYFQILPQNVIYLLSDIPPPVASDKILVFAPHPDDETIGAAGYIQRAAAARAEVWIVLVTDGNKHRLGRKRLLEFEKASALLGVPEQRLFNLGYPDTRLKKVNRRNVSLRFKSIIDTIKPNIVILPTPLDTHPDHSTTGEIILSLLLSSKTTLYEYLVHHPRFPRPEGLKTDTYMLPPTRLVNSQREWRRFMLTDSEVDRKLEATLQYKTQLVYPLPRNLLLGMARRNELFTIPERGAE